MTSTGFRSNVLPGMSAENEQAARSLSDGPCAAPGIGRAPCDGWDSPKDLGGWNVVNQHDTSGEAVGVLLGRSDRLDVWACASNDVMALLETPRGGASVWKTSVPAKCGPCRWKSETVTHKKSWAGTTFPAAVSQISLRLTPRLTQS